MTPSIRADFPSKERDPASPRSSTTPAGTVNVPPGARFTVEGTEAVPLGSKPLSKVTLEIPEPPNQPACRGWTRYQDASTAPSGPNAAGSRGPGSARTLTSPAPLRTSAPPCGLSPGARCRGPTTVLASIEPSRIRTAATDDGLTGRSCALLALSRSTALQTGGSTPRLIVPAELPCTYAASYVAVDRFSAAAYVSVTPQR